MSHVRYFDFEELPIGQEGFIIDEVYLEDFEEALYSMLEGGNPCEVGYSAWVVIEKVHKETAEISLILDNMYRYLTVDVLLPRSEFIKCIECSDWDIKPRFFVTTEWLHSVFQQQFSLYAMVDVIGVKEALRNGQLNVCKLLDLRKKLDEIAERSQQSSFISFADSLLIKQNWQTAYIKGHQSSTYNPEAIISTLEEIRAVYLETLGLPIYGIITQGISGYDKESPLHISASQNHVCLNTLGVPFSEIMSIEHAVRKALHDKVHPPAELYLDTKFYDSLNFKPDGREEASLGRYPYPDSMTSSKSEYVLSKCERLLKNLI